MARTTRSQSQRATRDALLASARDDFAAVGYSAASLDHIAEVAGYTRGAIHANFDGKAGLFLAVLDRRLERQLDELGRLRGQLDAVGSWRQRNATAEAGLALAVREFRAIAMRDDALRHAVLERERRVRSGFADVIERAADELHLALPASPHDVATVLIALGDGITEQHELDPERVSMDLFDRVVGALLRRAAD